MKSSSFHKLEPELLDIGEPEIDQLGGPEMDQLGWPEMDQLGSPILINSNCDNFLKLHWSMICQLDMIACWLCGKHVM